MKLVETFGRKKMKSKPTVDAVKAENKNCVLNVDSKLLFFKNYLRNK